MSDIPSILGAAFPRRPPDLHKYSAGTVTVVGGSSHFIHAPVIAGLGARAAGAGLVQLVVPDASRIAAGCLLPEATFTKQTPACVPPKADVTAIGMGLSTTQNAEMLLSRILSGSSGRFVLDADALTILSKWYARKESALPLVAGQTLVLTPHVGEAARLLACTPDEVKADRFDGRHGRPAHRHSRRPLGRAREARFGRSLPRRRRRGLAARVGFGRACRRRSARRPLDCQHRPRRRFTSSQTGKELRYGQL